MASMLVSFADFMKSRICFEDSYYTLYDYSLYHHQPLKGSIQYLEGHNNSSSTWKFMLILVE
jgi:hypothetical protein